MAEQTTPELKIGAVVISPAGIRYTITGVLGSGGFGITYSARVDEIRRGVRVVRRVALKEHFVRSMCGRNHQTQAIDVYSHNTDTFNRTLRDFIGEARRLKMIAAHPAIVTVSEVFAANNTAYYAMDLIDGYSLADIVAQRGAMSEAETMKLMRPVIDAVATLHHQRVTHLDIKPGNIMVDKRSGRPILIDFGLSKHYKDDGTPTSTINTQGVSAGFAPPEQYAGITKFSPASDVYALAATIIFCLTGKALPRSIDIRPGEIESMIPAALSPNVDYLLKSSLAFLADDRLPDGEAMLDVVCGRFVKPTSLVPTDTVEPTSDIKSTDLITAPTFGDKRQKPTDTPRKRIPWLSIIIVFFCALIGSLFVWYLLNQRIDFNRPIPPVTQQDSTISIPSDTISTINPGNDSSKFVMSGRIEPIDTPTPNKQPKPSPPTPKPAPNASSRNKNKTSYSGNVGVAKPKNEGKSDPSKVSTTKGESKKDKGMVKPSSNANNLPDIQYTGRGMTIDPDR